MNISILRPYLAEIDLEGGSSYFKHSYLSRKKSNFYLREVNTFTGKLDVYQHLNRILRGYYFKQEQ
jgi:hypothetical protein